jgi:response regulator RpfG family c-di-GMP phosphodiesterase
VNDDRALLLVDDEPNILRALKRLLRRDGYKITTAVGAVEGLKCLQASNFGVIISDQRMPDMNGTEFFSEVKNTHPNTMRVILSGYTDLKTITDAINQGSIYKFFTKPWDDEQLRANILEAFEIYELQQENEKLAHELRLANAQLEKRIETEKRYASINLGLLQVSQEILQHIPVAVVALDSESMLVSVNQAAINILDSQKLAVGQFSADVFPSNIIDIIEQSDGNVITKSIEISAKKLLLSVVPLQGDIACGGVILAFENYNES